jgi:hypothetical protein
MKTKPFNGDKLSVSEDVIYNASVERTEGQTNNRFRYPPDLDWSGEASETLVEWVFESAFEATDED